MGFAFGEKKAKTKKYICQRNTTNQFFQEIWFFFLGFFLNSGCVASVTGGYVGQHGGYKRKDHSDSSGDNGPLLM